MEISLILLEQIAQLFLLLLMGYVVVKLKLLRSEDSRVLSVVMVYLATPCVIINAFQVDYTPQVMSGLLFSFALAIAAHVLFLLASRLLRRPFAADDDAAQKQVAFLVRVEGEVRPADRPAEDAVQVGEAEHVGHGVLAALFGVEGADVLPAAKDEFRRERGVAVDIRRRILLERGDVKPFLLAFDDQFCHITFYLP